VKSVAATNERRALASEVVASQPPPAKRTARKRDIKFGDASGVDAWRAGIEQALQDEANNLNRDPKLPPIAKTTMVNRFGQRAFEATTWT
jgi:hypothetical protein